MVIGAIANIKTGTTKSGKTYTTFGIKYDYNANAKKCVYCNCIIWGDYSNVLTKNNNYMIFGLIEKDTDGNYSCNAKYITECISPVNTNISKETSETLNSMLSDNTPF